MLNHIATLTDSMDTCRGYLDVIDRSSKVEDRSLSEHLIWTTHQKIQILVIALGTAPDQMHVLQNWDKYCQEAVILVENIYGVRTIKSY